MTVKTNNLMTTKRLYNRPPQTMETLKAILAGASTVEDLSEELEIGRTGVYNRLHDPKILGVVRKDDGEYTLTNIAKRVVQLEDETALKDPFLDLPGIDEIQARLEESSEVPFEKIGRVIAFKTDSNATDEETFVTYGRVYAHWFDYLDLGYVGGSSLYKEKSDVEPSRNHPLDSPQGVNSPTCRPKKVFEALDYADKVNSKKEMSDALDYGMSTTGNILSTCYSLDVLEKKPGRKFRITDLGNELRVASKGNQEKLLRDQLLKLPLVQAFCNRIPEEEFSVHEVMEEVSDDYRLGWNETTIQSKAKRLYRWLIFTGLVEEVSQGSLVSTDVVQQRKIPDP